MPSSALILVSAHVPSEQTSLGECLHKELQALGYNATIITLTGSIDSILANITPSITTNLKLVVMASSTSSRQPRADMISTSQLDQQFQSSFINDMLVQTKVILNCLPHLLRNAVPLVDPSQVLVLSTRMARASGSPGQMMAAASQKAMLSICGSLFFENRKRGLKVSSILQGVEEIPLVDLAKCILFPLRVGPTACVETVDLSTCAVPPQRKPLSLSFRGACFVTGGSKGIGKSIALSICQRFKMPVALLGRDLDSLAEAKRECAAFVSDKNVLTFAFDVRDNAQMKKAIDATSAAFGGGLTVLVCSAGLNRRRPAISADGKHFADPKPWQELVDINLSSSMSAAGYAMPHLVHGLTSEGVAPAIFFVGSRISRLGGAPGQQSYAASKMGIAGFNQSIHQEIRQHGIRTCVLNVGIVSTELGNRRPKAGSFDITSHDKLIQPGDVGAACVFTLESAPHVAPTAFDMSGTTPEFIGKDGGNLKMSQL